MVWDHWRPRKGDHLVDVVVVVLAIPLMNVPAAQPGHRALPYNGVLLFYTLRQRCVVVNMIQ